MTSLKEDLSSLRLDRTSALRSRRRWLWWLLTLIAVGAVALILTTRQHAPLPVETGRPVLSRGGPAPGTPILNASGYLVPRRKAVVSSKIQGRLAQLRVEEGSRIEAGAILARLEQAEFVAQVGRSRAAIERAEADLAEARRQLELSTRLFDQGVGSRDARDAAASRVRIADATLSQGRAELVVAQAQLETTEIRAPFTGTVLRKMAEVGESVAPIPPGVNISSASGAIVVLADLDTLEAEVDVAESNVASLAEANPAEVTVEAFPAERYRAALRQVIPTADRTKATVMVKVTLLDTDRRLKPEMSAKVTFLASAGARELSTAAAAIEITVPSTAVVLRDGVDQVFVIEQGKAVPRPVQLGPRRGGSVVIDSGLAGEEVVILTPPDGLRPGDPVVSRS